MSGQLSLLDLETENVNDDLLSTNNIGNEFINDFGNVGGESVIPGAGAPLSGGGSTPFGDAAAGSLNTGGAAPGNGALTIPEFGELSELSLTSGALVPGISLLAASYTPIPPSAPPTLAQARDAEHDSQAVHAAAAVTTFKTTKANGAALNNVEHVFGNGNDNVTVLGEGDNSDGLLNAALDLGAGNNKLTVTAKGTGIKGTYDATPTLDSPSLVVTGAGADTVSVTGKTGMIYSVLDTGAGNDVITVSSTGSTQDNTYIALQNAAVNAGAGANTVTLNGAAVDSLVEAGDGADKITVNGDLDNTLINAGGGANTLVFTGDVAHGSSVNSDAGNDVMTFNKTLEDSTVNAGDGNNTVTLNGEVSNATVRTGDGADKVYLNAALAAGGRIETGSGNDTVFLGKSGTVSGTLDGGEGVDTLNAAGFRAAFSLKDIASSPNSVQHMEILDLTAVQANTLTLRASELAAFSPDPLGALSSLKVATTATGVTLADLQAGLTNSTPLRIHGDKADTVSLNKLDAWSVQGSVTCGGVAYNIYKSSDASGGKYVLLKTDLKAVTEPTDMELVVSGSGGITVAIPGAHSNSDIVFLNNDTGNIIPTPAGISLNGDGTLTYTGNGTSAAFAWRLASENTDVMHTARVNYAPTVTTTLGNFSDGAWYEGHGDAKYTLTTTGDSHVTLAGAMLANSVYNGGAGDDVVVLEGNVLNSYKDSANQNTQNNASAITAKINLGEGDNELTATSQLYGTTVTGGAGKDVIRINGMYDALRNSTLDLKGGDNEVVFDGNSSAYNSKIIAGTGNDVYDLGIGLYENSSLTDTGGDNTASMGVLNRSSVTFGAGNDELAVANGVSGGTIKMGDGDNVVTVTSIINGQDALDYHEANKVASRLETGKGNDTITIDAAGNGSWGWGLDRAVITDAGGNNRVTISGKDDSGNTGQQAAPVGGAMTGGTVTLAAGNNGLYVTGAVVKNSAINTGAGNDTVVLMNDASGSGAYVKGGLLGSTLTDKGGDNTVYAATVRSEPSGASLVAGKITLGAGHDTVYIGDVTGQRFGTETLNVSGTKIGIGRGAVVDLGAGNNEVHILAETGMEGDLASGGKVTATLSTGAGNDTVTIGGASTTNAMTAATYKDSGGNNVVNISGTDAAMKASTVTLGGGNDKVNIAGDVCSDSYNDTRGNAVTVQSKIDTGAGDDTVTLESGSVKNSQILLGAGNDELVLRASGYQSQSNAALKSGSTVDGGAGLDKISLLWEYNGQKSAALSEIMDGTVTVKGVEILDIHANGSYADTNVELTLGVADIARFTGMQALADGPAGLKGKQVLRVHCDEGDAVSLTNPPAEPGKYSNAVWMNQAFAPVVLVEGIPYRWCQCIGADSKGKDIVVSQVLIQEAFPDYSGAKLNDLSASVASSLLVVRGDEDAAISGAGLSGGLRQVYGKGNDVLTIQDATSATNPTGADGVKEAMLDMGAGNNKLTIDVRGTGVMGGVASGTQAALVTMGAGNDTVTISGVTAALDKAALVVGEGNNTVILNGDVVNVSNIYAGSGADKVTLNGALDTYSGIYTGDGNDTIAVTGNVLGTIDAGAGNDSITVNGTVTGVINAGEGNNTVIVNGLVDGFDTRIIAESGNDTITVNGNLDNGAMLDAGNGNNVITLNGDVVNGSRVYGVYGNAGSGTDKVTLNGNLGAGSDIYTGSGNDSVTVTGNIAGLLSTGLGNDSISVNGVISGELNAGVGNDTIYLGANGSVTGTGVLDGGAGTDVLQLNGFKGSFSLSDIASGGGTVQGIEILDLSGTTANTLTVKAADMAAFTPDALVLSKIGGTASPDVKLALSTTGALRIHGDAKDKVNLDVLDGWGDKPAGTVTYEGVSYNVWQAGSSYLLIKSGVPTVAGATDMELLCDAGGATFSVPGALPDGSNIEILDRDLNPQALPYQGITINSGNGTLTYDGTSGGGIIIWRLTGETDYHTASVKSASTTANLGDYGEYGSWYESHTTAVYNLTTKGNSHAIINGDMAAGSKFTGGDGADHVVANSIGATGARTTINLGKGDNRLETRANGNIENTDVTAGSGADYVKADTIKNSKLTLGDGQNEVYGGIKSSTITLGKDKDTVTGEAYNSTIDLGEGNNILSLTGNAGDTSNGLGDSVPRQGIAEKATLKTGAGDDTVTINCSDGWGMYDSTLTDKGGANTITVAGVYTAGSGGAMNKSTITLGGGADSVDITGMVHKSTINTGAGADTVTLRSDSGGSSGLWNSTLDTGAGDDVVNLHGVVRKNDASFAASLKLGDGNDKIYVDADGMTPGEAVFGTGTTLDGGAGVDTLYLKTQYSGTSINMSNIAAAAIPAAPGVSAVPGATITGIEILSLAEADNATLTLSSADIARFIGIQAVSGGSAYLRIQGDSDDTLHLTGAWGIVAGKEDVVLAGDSAHYVLWKGYNGTQPVYVYVQKTIPTQAQYPLVENSTVNFAADPTELHITAKSDNDGKNPTYDIGVTSGSDFDVDSFANNTMKFNFGGGNDTVALSGLLSSKTINLNMGDGNNEITLSTNPQDNPMLAADLRLQSKITAGGGNDTFTATQAEIKDGTLIDLGNGANVVNITNPNVNSGVDALLRRQAQVKTGDGADSITITNNNPGNGLNRKCVMDSIIDTGGGNDTVTIDAGLDGIALGYETGTVDPGQSKNNTGSQLLTGAGDDSVTITGKVAKSTINAGTGNDEIHVNVGGSAVFDANSKLDGGAGIDTLYLKTATQGTSINMGNIAATGATITGIEILSLAEADSARLFLSSADIARFTGIQAVSGGSAYLRIQGDSHDILRLTGGTWDVVAGKANVELDGLAYTLWKCSDGKQVYVQRDVEVIPDGTLVEPPTPTNLHITATTAANDSKSYTITTNDSPISKDATFSTHSKTFHLGNGNDTVVLSGELNEKTINLYMGEGNNSITLQPNPPGDPGQNSYLSHSKIMAGSGDDTFTLTHAELNDKTIVNLGDGNNTVTMTINAQNTQDSHNTFNGAMREGAQLITGAGNDTITITNLNNPYAPSDGSCVNGGVIDAGNGDNLITISGNTALNSGGILSTATASATFDTRLVTGIGNDTIGITGNVEHALVSTGAGNDKVTFHDRLGGSSGFLTNDTSTWYDSDDKKYYKYGGPASKLDLGAGDDTLRADIDSYGNPLFAAGTTFDGGAGVDTLILHAGTEPTIAMRSIADDDATITGVEILSLTDTSMNTAITLSLSAADIARFTNMQAISGGDLVGQSILRIQGDASDAIRLGDQGWTKEQSPVNVEGTDYYLWTYGDTKVLIQTGVKDFTSGISGVMGVRSSSMALDDLHDEDAMLFSAAAHTTQGNAYNPDDGALRLALDGLDGLAGLDGKDGKTGGGDLFGNHSDWFADLFDVSGSGETGRLDTLYLDLTGGSADTLDLSESLDSLFSVFQNAEHADGATPKVVISSDAVDKVTLPDAPQGYTVAHDGDTTTYTDSEAHSIQIQVEKMVLENHC